MYWIYRQGLNSEPEERTTGLQLNLKLPPRFGILTLRSLPSPSPVHIDQGLDPFRIRTHRDTPVKPEIVGLLHKYPPAAQFGGDGLEAAFCIDDRTSAVALGRGGAVRNLPPARAVRAHAYRTEVQ